MASPVGDSDRVDWLARTCSDEGASIKAAGDRCVSELERLERSGSWAGPAADAAERWIANEALGLGRVRDELEDIATELRAHAQWIRDRERHLRAVERSVRAKLEHAGSPPPGMFGIPEVHLHIIRDVLLWCRLHVSPLGHDGLPAPLTDGWEALERHLERGRLARAFGGGGGGGGW